MSTVLMVRGSTYDVDVVARVMRAAYWKETPASIVRGITSSDVDNK